MRRALSDLRSDMKTQALDELKAHADKKQDEANVQKLIDKQTSDLQVRDRQRERGEKGRERVWFGEGGRGSMDFPSIEF